MKIVLFCLLISLSTLCSATEGAKPYTPSKLEWLALTMNVTSGSDYSDNGIYLQFVGLEKVNTIQMFVRYQPTVDRKLLNLKVNHAAELLRAEIEGRGWDSWIKVDEDIEMSKPRG